MSGPFFADRHVTLWHGDCLDVMATMPDANVDAVVTDPPYDLTSGKRGGSGVASLNLNSPAGRARISTGFMGKSWDGTGVAFRPETWAECLRVLKPGGHLLAFGGSRTWHRLACAVEDAGFEVRDSIAWLYGSGFPKSLDVSKAIDKAEGIWRGRAGDIESGNESMGGANYERTDKGAPVTAAAAAAGWGTALKPAFEPIIVARKSLVGTVAANWLEHGTGALNIDACRVGSDRGEQEYTVTRWKPGATLNREGGTWKRQDGDAPTVSGTLPSGRWPTNVVFDESQADALDEQTGVTASRIGKPRGAASGAGWGMTATGTEYNDTGGASRFFPTFRYEAKAQTVERPRDGEVAHPTVKPLDLMRWLVRLVTPPGGLVLDPFAGSGTTAEACVLEGFRCVTIEREAAYLPLIKARLCKPLQPVFDFGASA